MSKTRLARAAAIAAAAAALSVLLFGGSAAPAEDLQSKLESKEQKLSHVRERKGVLTTTISRYGDRIDTLTGQVAALRPRSRRSRSGSTPSRPNSTARSPNSASPRTPGGRQSPPASGPGRAAPAARAIYETGDPDMLGVILGADGYGELVARAEYLDRINGMDEAVVSRVRELRDQVRAPSSGCAPRRTGSKRRATRSPPKSRRWPVPAAACRGGRRRWSRPAPERESRR